MPTVPYTPIQNGEEGDQNLWNARFLALHDAINGGLDANNLADNAVTAPKLATDAVTTVKIAANAITAAKIETQQAWQTPTLLNNWVNYDATHEAAGYYKDTLGIVHLKGLLKNGTIPANMFVLPVGFRPAKVQHFVCNAAGLAGGMRLSEAGEVKPENGSNAYFSISGLTFRAEA